MRTDVGDGIDVVRLPPFGLDLPEHVASSRVDHFPDGLAAQWQPEASTVGRHPEAVGVFAHVLAPHHRVAPEVERDQLVGLVRGDVQESELRARADPLVIAAVRDRDRP